METITKVAILGAGAMGAVYAAKFFEAPGFATQIIARQPRYDRLKNEGLIVNDQHYAIPVVHPDQADSSADLILVALKAHHLPEAVHDLQNLVGEQTVIVSVMNGLDSEAYLAAVYGSHKVLLAIAVGIDAVRQGNSVVYTKLGKICFGEPEKFPASQRALDVQQMLARAGIVSEIPPDMVRMLWWKFMINVGINQASAVMRAPYGAFHASAEARELMDMLMREVLDLARQAKVNLGEQDLADWSAVLHSLSADGKTSMLQDIEAGRKTEVETFAGKVVALGREYGVPTPINQAVLCIIHVLEQQSR